MAESDPEVSDVLDTDEPLLSTEVPLSVEGEGDEFRTQNASVEDWERRNVIERTQDAIHIRCDLMDVVHGWLEEAEGDYATLMTFRFRFDPQKQSRRLLRARVNIEFFPATKGGSAPEVVAIAPEERWSVAPTVDKERIVKGGELTLGASGVPFVDAGGSAKLEKTIRRDVSDATTVTGSINLGTGKNSVAPTSAAWTLLENKRRGTGLPDSLRVVVLLKREDEALFNAKVTLEANADLATSFGSLFKKQVPLDDPVLFNPKLKPKRTKPGRKWGAENLGSTDLYSLCEVRMAVEAFFAAK